MKTDQWHPFSAALDGLGSADKGTQWMDGGDQDKHGNSDTTGGDYAKVVTFTLTTTLVLLLLLTSSDNAGNLLVRPHD